MRYWGRDRREVQKNKRMSGDKQHEGVGGAETLWKVPETWEVTDSNDSLGVNLVKMSNIGDRELNE